MTVIAIPAVLREKLGENGTMALTDLLNQIEGGSYLKAVEITELRFEKRLSEEIGKLRSDIIRWMFIFWIGQAVTIIGFMLAILKP